MSDIPLSALFGGDPPPPRDQEIAIAFGKVNLTGQLATYFAGTVSAPFVRKSASETGDKVTGSSHVAQVSNWEANGALYSSRVKHAANTVIMLQTSWFRNGSPHREGCVFIRLRANGPLITVQARTPQGGDNNLPSAEFVMFSGRGDIMDAQELAVLGIMVPQNWQNRFMDAEEIAECYDVMEIVPEKSPRPIIARIVSGGEAKLVEMPVAPRRRIIVRR